jgi:DNA/RNA-binding protein KIN17
MSSAKAIAKKIKAKGLLKLRFFCQMCNKSCRDANGFKCHQTTEGHLRQMALFRDNPEKYMNDFSREFEQAFLDTLRRIGRNLIKANKVYNEVIKDRAHVHMNATIWPTLSNFVAYLGKTGKAYVEQDDEDLLVRHIQRDQALLARQAAMRKKERAELDSEERQARRLRKQIAMAHALAKGDGTDLTNASASASSSASADEEKKVLKRTDPDAKLSFGLSLSSKNSVSSSRSSTGSGVAVAVAVRKSRFDTGSSGSDKSVHTSSAVVGTSVQSTRKRKADMSPLEELAAEIEAKKQAALRKKAKTEEHHTNAVSSTASSNLPAGVIEAPIDPKKEPWVTTGIIVRVMIKSREKSIYKKKGKVIELTSPFFAKVHMLKSGDTVMIDQTELETVIPKFGSPILVVAGMYKGTIATLESLQQDTFSVTIRQLDGSLVAGIPLEHVCKVSQ